MSTFFHQPTVKSSSTSSSVTGVTKWSVVEWWVANLDGWNFEIRYNVPDKHLSMLKLRKTRVCFLNKYWCIYISLCLCIFLRVFFCHFSLAYQLLPLFFASTCPRVARKKRLRRGWDHNHSGGLSCRQVRWGRLGHDFCCLQEVLGSRIFLWNAKIMMIYDYNVVHMFDVEDMKDHHERFTI